MGTKRKTGTQMVSQQLREAIDGSGQSRYAICKATGIPQSNMSRFMSGQSGLSMESLDTLCEFLGLELKPTGRTRTKGG